VSFVLDASVTLAWVFEDEDTPMTEAALEALRQTEALVPSIWHYEIGNALVVGARRGKLTPATAAHFTELLQNLPFMAVEASAALLWATSRR
jgi:predicted nucleic acid-binding protein